MHRRDKNEDEFLDDDCEYCKGTGELGEETCPYCAGTGVELPEEDPYKHIP